MYIEQTLEELLHHLLDFSEAELHVVVGQQPGQVMLTEVKHKVERRAPPVVCGGCGWMSVGEWSGAQNQDRLVRGMYDNLRCKVV